MAISLRYLRYVFAGLVVCIFLGLPAFADTRFTVSQRDRWIGAGIPHQTILDSEQTFTSNISADRTAISININDNARSEWIGIELAAPKGQSLTVSRYLGATRSAFRAAGEPGIDVHGNGRGCNKIGGEFEILELDINSNGTLNRFAAIFTQQCENFGTPLKAGVRINSQMNIDQLSDSDIDQTSTPNTPGGGSPTACEILSFKGFSGSPTAFLSLSTGELMDVSGKSIGQEVMPGIQSQSTKAGGIKYLATFSSVKGISVSASKGRIKSKVKRLFLNRTFVIDRDPVLAGLFYLGASGQVFQLKAKVTKNKQVKLIVSQVGDYDSGSCN